MTFWPTRLALACLAVLTVFGGSATAGKKGKIAILGLEVLGSSSTIDSESTRVAQDLTVALRLHPKAGKGPYEWTPGSEKELVDEKIMNNCSGEEKTCMAKIGSNLGADYLAYGKIERKSLGGQAGYQITLKLLKVNGAAQLPGWTEFIPLNETNGTKLQDWAAKGYKTLTHDFDGGSLRITVRNDGFDRGIILVDGEERGNITGGTGDVPSLPEGRYKISVVATGYDRWDSDDKITIHNGETTNQEVTLKKARRADCDPMVSNDCGGTISDDGPKTGLWKGMMAGGIVIGVVGGVFWGYSAGKLNDVQNNCKAGLGPDNAKCPFTTDKARDAEGNKQSRNTYIGGGLVAAGAALAVIGFIKGFVVTGGKERVSSRHSKRHHDFAVIPTVTDRSAGATLRLSW